MEVKAEAPEVNVEVPEVKAEVKVPEFKVKRQAPDIPREGEFEEINIDNPYDEIKLPELDVDVEKPSVEVETPDVPAVKGGENVVVTTDIVTEVHPPHEKDEKEKEKTSTLERKKKKRGFFSFGGKDKKKKRGSVSSEKSDKSEKEKSEEKKLELEIPSLNVDVKEESGDDLKVEVKKPEVDLEIEKPDVNLDLKTPEVEIEKPNLEVDVESPNVEVDVEKPELEVDHKKKKVKKPLFGGFKFGRKKEGQKTPETKRKHSTSSISSEEGDKKGLSINLDADIDLPDKPEVDIETPKGEVDLNVDKEGFEVKDFVVTEEKDIKIKADKPDIDAPKVHLDTTDSSKDDGTTTEEDDKKSPSHRKGFKFGFGFGHKDKGHKKSSSESHTDTEKEEHEVGAVEYKGSAEADLSVDAPAISVEAPEVKVQPPSVEVTSDSSIDQKSPKSKKKFRSLFSRDASHKKSDSETTETDGDDHDGVKVGVDIPDIPEEQKVDEDIDLNKEGFEVKDFVVEESHKGGGKVHVKGPKIKGPKISFGKKKKDRSESESTTDVDSPKEDKEHEENIPEDKRRERTHSTSSASSEEDPDEKKKRKEEGSPKKKRFGFGFGFKKGDKKGSQRGKDHKIEAEVDGPGVNLELEPPEVPKVELETQQSDPKDTPELSFKSELSPEEERERKHKSLSRRFKDLFGGHSASYTVNVDADHKQKKDTTTSESDDEDKVFKVDAPKVKADLPEAEGKLEVNGPKVDVDLESPKVRLEHTTSTSSTAESSDEQKTSTPTSRQKFFGFHWGNKDSKKRNSQKIEVTSSSDGEVIEEIPSSTAEVSHTQQKFIPLELGDHQTNGKDNLMF